MHAGLILLCLAYVLSQFFRAFLAVLASVLEQDIGTGPEDLALASGLWFLSFAAMQLPVGWALDRIGPRLTASVLFLIGGGGGAAVFALATTALHINIAMFLIGVGCAPVLMASYYIFAREFPPARFATLAALMVGVGSLGNLGASYPTALAVDWVGWRATLAGLAALSVVIAAGIFIVVRDPEPVTGPAKGSLLDLLKRPVIWAILPLMFFSYVPSGALRGLWIGPYLRDVFGLEPGQIGQATLVMSVAMIAGTFFFGPLDRIFGTRKWVIFTASLGGAVAMMALALWAGHSVAVALTLIALVGFLGGTYPVIIAHGRSFAPPHLAGRGVTLLNLFAIGGVGLMQLVSGRMHQTLSAGNAEMVPYQYIFGVFGVALLLGSLIYLFSRDSMA